MPIFKMYRPFPVGCNLLYFYIADGKTKDSGSNGCSHFSELNNKLNVYVRYVITFQPIGF